MLYKHLLLILVSKPDHFKLPVFLLNAHPYISSTVNIHTTQQVWGKKRGRRGKGKLPANTEAITCINCGSTNTEFRLLDGKSFINNFFKWLKAFRFDLEITMVLFRNLLSMFLVLTYFFKDINVFIYKILCCYLSCYFMI